MLHIDITQAAPGMTIAMPILHPQRPDSVLLRAGYEIDRTTLRRLDELNQRTLWVNAPGLESIDEYLCGEVEIGRRKLFLLASQALGDIHDPSGRRQTWNDLGEAIGALTETLVANPTAALFVEDDDAVEFRMIGHAANVTYLATLIGMKLQGYLLSQRKRLDTRHATNLITLALGAMMHDVGLVKLHESVIARWHEHHDDSDPAWQKHVQHGYEIVSGKVDSAAAAAVLHHHQYFDGSGFPKRPDWDGGRESGMKGDAIHIFARIVTIADQFDELRTFYFSRPRPLVEVLANLTCGRMSRRFDPVILRALLEIVPAYTPGRRVTLSTGEEAFVVNWRPASPCRPKVVVIEDLAALSRGEAPPSRFIDLAITADVSITHSQGVDVSQCQFSLPENLAPRREPGPGFNALDAA